MTRLHTAMISLLLFAIAMALRLPTLNTFLTPDETVWAGAAAQYITAWQQGDWAATNVSGHPGVTTTWAGSLGLVIKWLLQRPPGVDSLAGLAQILAANPINLDFLPWLRFPVALATSLGVVILYLLSRKLLTEVVALLAVFFLLFDPFYLAHSRVLQMDALLATSIAIAWLALLIATRTGQRRYQVLCGLFIGLAVLTKSPALVMGPLILAWILWQRLHDRQSPHVLRDIVLDLLAVGTPALLIFFALWPALWVAPVDTLGRMWNLMTVYSGVGHELGNYWLGQAVTAPGSLFYGAVVLLRTTPVTLSGLLLAITALFLQIVGRIRNEHRPEPDQAERDSIMALLVAAIWFGAILSIGEKKFDRYLLPLFPFLDFLAAWGWVNLGRWLVRSVKVRGLKTAHARMVIIAGGGLLVLLHGGSAIASRGDYLTVYNPLLGGLRTARQVMLVGWGEGLEKAAEFLNQAPGAENQRVASWYGGNVFAAFYEGTSLDNYYDLRTAADFFAGDIDYVVTYINQDQRALLHESVTARLGEPLLTVEQGGVSLAQVYAWPKPYTHTTERALTDGLLLLGWTLGGFDPLTRQLPVSFYWDTDSLQQITEAPDIVVWVKDAAGEVWEEANGEVQAGAWNQENGWLDHTVTAQTLAINLPAGLLAGTYRLEMAPQTGQGIALGALDVPATQSDRVSSAIPNVPTEEVLFGDSVVFKGYDYQRTEEQLTLDLFWEAKASPPQNVTAFVHVVDESEMIIAQHDASVTQLPGQEPQPWYEGELLRQRLRVSLPDPVPANSRVYIGLYLPDTGARLSLLSSGRIIEDGRYLILEGFERIE